MRRRSSIPIPQAVNSPIEAAAIPKGNSSRRLSYINILNIFDTHHVFLKEYNFSLDNGVLLLYSFTKGFGLRLSRFNFAIVNEHSFTNAHSKGIVRIRIKMISILMIIQCLTCYFVRINDILHIVSLNTFISLFFVILVSVATWRN